MDYFQIAPCCQHLWLPFSHFCCLFSLYNSIFVTAVPSTSLDPVVKWVGEGDVYKACVAVVRASVSSWPQWLLSGIYQAPKADGYCLVTHIASYCCTNDSNPFYCKNYGYCLSRYYCYVSNSTPYCLALEYCPHLRVVLSRSWDRPVDPSLILLSILIQGCIALSSKSSLILVRPLVFVTSSESSKL